MELSEAKERISQLIGYGELLIEGMKEENCENTVKAIEAWNIIKKALDNSIDKKQHDMIVKSMNSIIDSLQEKLDNSISKDEVRKKIEECVKRRQELANGHFWESPSNINEDTALVMAQTLYQELLGDD